MDDLALAQETDHVVDVRIVRQAQDVVVGDPGFLFGSEVLGQVSDHIALDRHGRRAPREAGRGGGVHPRRAIHEVGVKSGGLDLLLGQAAGQLVNDGADHLQVAKLLGAYKRVKMEPEANNARIARVSGAVSSRKHECVDSGIPVFYEHGAGWDTTKSEAYMAN